MRMIVDKREFEERVRQLGARILELRRAAGLSQMALAKAAKVGQSRISDWELGSFAPSAVYVPTLAAALGVTVAQLFEPATPPTASAGRAVKGKSAGRRRGKQSGGQEK